MRRTTASTGRDVPSPTFPPPSAQMFSVERRAVAATTSYDVYDGSGGYVAKIERELLSLTPQVDTATHGASGPPSRGRPLSGYLADSHDRPARSISSTTRATPIRSPTSPPRDRSLIGDIPSEMAEGRRSRASRARWSVAVRVPVNCCRARRALAGPFFL